MKSKISQYLLFQLIIITILFVGSGFIFVNITNAQEILLPELKIPGTIEAEGTHFEITDSDYLNITINSSETVRLRVESVPEMITMMIVPVVSSGTTSTQITLSGFTPLTKYYKYQDDYHNLEEFITDENGNYTYTQDISKCHFIFIQPRASTKFIKDDATGGDCYLIGVWDSPTKTCILTADLNETIQIDNNYITIDGNGHIMIGNNTGFGIYVYRKTGVIVKNFNITKFSYAMYFLFSDSNTILNNIANFNGEGIFFDVSNYNTIVSNFISNSLSGNASGIIIGGGYNNIINKNIANSNNNFGIKIYRSDNNVLSENSVSFNEHGIAITFSNNNIIKENTITRNSKVYFNRGLVLYSSDNNKVYNNNFIDNPNQIYLYAGSNNVFNLDKPIGGNFWSNFDTPAEGCEDLNNDNFCDSSYVFSDGQDNLPWTKQDGWVEKTLSEKAADLAKELVNSLYLYGGKGWDYNQDEFVLPDTVKTGYNFWNQERDNVDFGAGVDCSGLIMWAYDRSFDPTKSRFNNFVKAEGADGQFRENTTTTTELELQPGDVMFFDLFPISAPDGFIDHVAMYVGESGGFDVVSAVDENTGIVPRSKDILKNLSRFRGFKQVISALQPAILVSAGSPVDLTVTDPDGFTIMPDTIIPSELEFLRQIPGVLYYSEMERGADGRPIDQVYSYTLKTGDYSIQVLPEPGSSFTDVYTLTAIAGDTTIILASSTPIADTPTEPYIIRSSEGEIEKIISAKIRIEPETLNLSSKGVFTAFIQIEKGFGVTIDDINPATITISGAHPARTAVDQETATLIAKFNRQDLVNTPAGKKVKLTLKGKLFDKTSFEGSDTIRVIDRKAADRELSALLANLYSILMQLLNILREL